jgi:hypothetical protein
LMYVSALLHLTHGTRNNIYCEGREVARNTAYIR